MLSSPIFIGAMAGLAVWVLIAVVVTLVFLRLMHTAEVAPDGELPTRDDGGEQPVR